MIPKIVERKIQKSTKTMEAGDYTQYTITLPKEYGEQLEKKGIGSLLIAYNYGLGAFPKQGTLTEKALLTFMQKHPELQKLFSKLTKQEDTK